MAAGAHEGPPADQGQGDAIHRVLASGLPFAAVQVNVQVTQRLDLTETWRITWNFYSNFAGESCVTDEDQRGDAVGVDDVDETGVARVQTDEGWRPLEQRTGWVQPCVNFNWIIVNISNPSPTGGLTCNSAQIGDGFTRVAGHVSAQTVAHQVEISRSSCEFILKKRFRLVH